MDCVRVVKCFETGFVICAFCGSIIFHSLHSEHLAMDHKHAEHDDNRPVNYRVVYVRGTPTAATDLVSPFQGIQNDQAVSHF